MNCTRWQEATIAVRGRQIPLRYRVAGPCLVRPAAGVPLFLLVVRGITEARQWRRRKPGFFLVNAAQRDADWVLPLPAAELLAWAWQRWEVEVCHRELKSGFGLGEIQSWSETGTEVAAQWQAWAYAVLVLAGVRTWGLESSTHTPPGRWGQGVPRWSLGTLWRGYRQALWGVGDFQALFTGTGDEWAAMATFRAAFANSAAASLRT